MEDVWSVEFAIKAVFFEQIYLDELTCFSLPTIKGKTPCFSTKKNTVRVIFYV